MFCYLTGNSRIRHSVRPRPEPSPRWRVGDHSWSPLEGWKILGDRHDLPNLEVKTSSRVDPALLKHVYGFHDSLLKVASLHTTCMDLATKIKKGRTNPRSWGTIDAFRLPLIFLRGSELCSEPRVAGYEDGYSLMFSCSAALPRSSRHSSRLRVSSHHRSGVRRINLPASTTASTERCSTRTCTPWGFLFSLYGRIAFKRTRSSMISLSSMICSSAPAKAPSEAYYSC